MRNPYLHLDAGLISKIVSRLNLLHPIFLTLIMLDISMYYITTQILSNSLISLQLNIKDVLLGEWVTVWILITWLLRSQLI